MPSILSDFRRDNPDVDVSISVGSIEQMYEGVKSGTLDCAFVSRQDVLMKSLSWHPLQVDELLAVLPPKDPFRGEVFPVERFSGADFLMPSLGFERDIEPLFSAAEPPVLPRIRCR